LGLDPINTAVLVKKTPILCVCLGAQLITESSEEGDSKGFGWIKGRTVRFKNLGNLRVPHMGWNSVNLTKSSRLFSNMPEDPCFYFVHSYHVVLDDPKDILATTVYGYEFVSAIERGNIFATLFHPEKSHKYGMCLLKNFWEF
jgi:glutamine amidotransferase